MVSLKCILPQKLWVAGTKGSVPFTVFLTLLCLVLETVCPVISYLCAVSAGPLLSEERWGCLVKTTKANYTYCTAEIIFI